MGSYGKLKNRLPAIMSLALVSVILLTAFLRAFEKSAPPFAIFTTPTSILALLYTLWIALEAKVAVSEPKKGSAPSDKISMELYALAQAATVITALAFGANRFAATHAVGMPLFIAGVTLRLSAVRTLGRSYSHMVRAEADQPIVDTGPYRVIRHPAYAGMIASHVGVLIALYNRVTLAILILGLVPAILFRIRIEEKALFALSGYPEFAKGRKCLVPMIW